MHTHVDFFKNTDVEVHFRPWISRNLIRNYRLQKLSRKFGKKSFVVNKSDYPFMHLLYSQLLVCQRVCLQNTVCLICK